MRVERLGKSYRFEDVKIYFTKNGVKVIVPEEMDRLDIAMEAYNFGHFGVGATMARVREKYFWKNMYIMVEKVVKACATCCRHTDGEKIESPARPTIVSGLFEKVGMDLATGFPKNDMGYIGCLVITEYLSKFPMVYPIRSKTAEEISDLLLEYISMFGTPTEILSDQ